jgi:hypothetical protein
MTGSDGSYSIKVPTDTKVYINLSKSGGTYVSTNFQIFSVSANDDSVYLVIVLAQDVTDLLAALGGPGSITDHLLYVAFVEDVNENEVAGLRIEITPDGPFGTLDLWYNDGADNYVINNPPTTNTGVMPQTAGWIPSDEAGIYTFTAKVDATNAVVDSMEIPLVADEVTVVFMEQ